MPFKPNYNHQRLERERAKQAKKEEKLREKRARKAEEDGVAPAEGAESEELPPDVAETEGHPS